MRRALGMAAVYAALVAGAVACKDSTINECLESGAIPYRVNAGTDTSATFRWPSGFMPVRFYAEAAGNLQANTDSALQLWTNAFRCNEVSVLRVTDSTIADVVLRNPVQMPPIPVAARVMGADSVGACLGRTDVLLDTIGRLERPIRSYVVAQNIDTTAVNACYHFVTAHEVGHTLGLFAHSPDPQDLMYVVPRRRLLSINDRFTIQLLYHLDQVGIQPVPR